MDAWRTPSTGQVKRLLFSAEKPEVSSLLKKSAFELKKLQTKLEEQEVMREKREKEHELALKERDKKISSLERDRQFLLTKIEDLQEEKPEKPSVQNTFDSGVTKLEEELSQWKLKYEALEIDSKKRLEANLRSTCTIESENKILKSTVQELERKLALYKKREEENQAQPKEEVSSGLSEEYQIIKRNLQSQTSYVQTLEKENRTIKAAYVTLQKRCEEYDILKERFHSLEKKLELSKQDNERLQSLETEIYKLTRERNAW
jgi:chromosome segregation ATPase